MVALRNRLATCKLMASEKRAQLSSRSVDRTDL